MVETTEIEKKSLEAHVELCAERYKFLEHKLIELESDIGEVKDTATKTHQLVTRLSEKSNDRLIAWGIGVIGFLMATIGYLVAHYVFK
jgi:hypothetical protein